MKTVLITGVTGMDGSILLDMCLDKGHTVVGLKRRSSTDTTQRIKHRLGQFTLEECDITDAASVNNIFAKYKPDLIFNMAAESHVATSFNQPCYTFQANTVGVINLLEAMRQYTPQARMVQASTSEMFGNNYTIVDDDGNLKKAQNNVTSFCPTSPYACAKLAAHHMVQTYRNSYKLFVCSAISFNHTGKRRGELFVSRKITQYVAKLYHASKKYYEIGSPKQLVIPPLGFEKLYLGNITSARDWTHADDICRGLYMMLQQDQPDDYILCSGEAHTVENFLFEAFQCIGIDYKPYVEIDPRLYRPAEVDYLCGDSSKAKELLGWYPTVGFKDLVKIMVDADIILEEKNDSR